jgi:hypothetical protein
MQHCSSIRGRRCGTSRGSSSSRNSPIPGASHGHRCAPSLLQGWVVWVEGASMALVDQSACGTMACRFRISMHIRTEHFPTDGTLSLPSPTHDEKRRMVARRRRRHCAVREPLVAARCTLLAHAADGVGGWMRAEEWSAYADCATAITPPSQRESSTYVRLLRVSPDLGARGGEEP